MERTNSTTVSLLRLWAGYEDQWWGEFLKDNGRVVRVVLVEPTRAGICLAAGFVATGGRNIS
jgi:hypothetical protein